MHLSQNRYICESWIKHKWQPPNLNQHPWSPTFIYKKKINPLRLFLIPPFTDLLLVPPISSCYLSWTHKLCQQGRLVHACSIKLSLVVVKRILGYLAGTPQHDVLLHQESSSFIISFSDADWGVKLDDCKSTTNFCIYLGSNLISWSTHKQKNSVSKQHWSWLSCCHNCHDRAALDQISSSRALHSHNHSQNFLGQSWRCPLEC